MIEQDYFDSGGKLTLILVDHERPLCPIEHRFRAHDRRGDNRQAECHRFEQHQTLSFRP